MNELIQLATTQAELPRTQVSQLLGIGRATIFRNLHATSPAEREVVVRDRIQKIAL